HLVHTQRSSAGLDTRHPGIRHGQPDHRHRFQGAAGLRQDRASVRLPRRADHRSGRRGRSNRAGARRQRAGDPSGAGFHRRPRAHATDLRTLRILWTRLVHEKAASQGGMMTVKIGETEMEKKILFAINEDWLAQRREDPIDPAMPIIDPHHHLWDRGSRYLLEEIKADIDTSGHNIRTTVFLQCDSMYRADGDPKFAPLGETEF